MPFLVKQSLGTDAILSMPRITKGNVAGENVRMSLPFSGKKEKESGGGRCEMSR